MNESTTHRHLSRSESKSEFPRVIITADGLKPGKNDEEGIMQISLDKYQLRNIFLILIW